ncbi:exporter of polyketide antibiotics [Actinoplanes sp. NBRC 14428]|uniref:ABC-2 type transport system permease protein n=1 Tax=Pseudosporangium ferrugineum TaxID=439699 RepID=A0A2T0SG55_9ACTN|nr:ABC antibiotics transporter [Pseudosporangium ferrugineum]PRY32392.1 ABC-2 type transport system permease protein [Pseudosporangium ferrugineum]BCJ49358.1 exporter of polyketide antibiotics [Actinoplanes sp. NBRC 14428]
MNALAGLPALTRLALRRDRFTLPAWLLGLSAFTAATTAMWAADLTDPADLARESRLAATSPGIRLLGLASGGSAGAYAMVRNFVLLAVLAALMSVFAVVRHTRQGEETGRAELVGAAAVGRHAPLTAALIVAVAADAALAVLLGLALAAAGMPAAGSFTAGAAVGAVGLVFAGVAAVTTQLSATTRGASGQAAAVLGAAFLAAGVGNMAGDPDATGLRVRSAWPAWLSPIGWGQQARAFDGNHWWPLGLAAGCFLAATAIAVRLTARRDFGRGLLPERTGHRRAGRLLRGPIGLAARLQRGALLGWATGMLGFGLIMGGLAGQVADATGSAREWYTRTGGSDVIVDAYRTSILQMAGLAAAIYVVQVLLRLRTEEADGPLEPVLAAAVGRVRWALGHAVTALAGATALLLLFALGAAATAGAVLGDPVGEVRTLVPAALVQLPAVLVVGAAVIGAVALLPRLAGGVAWAALIAAVLTGPIFGTTLGLPGWVRDLSPFTHVPKAPAVAVGATPLIALGAVLAVLLLAGLIRLRRRDLSLPA